MLDHQHQQAIVSKSCLSWLTTWHRRWNAIFNGLSMVFQEEFYATSKNFSTSLVARCDTSIDVRRTAEGANATVQLTRVKFFERSVLKERLVDQDMMPYAAGTPAQEYQVVDLRCVSEGKKQLHRDMGPTCTQTNSGCHTKSRYTKMRQHNFQFVTACVTT